MPKKKKFRKSIQQQDSKQEMLIEPERKMNAADNSLNSGSNTNSQQQPKQSGIPRKRFSFSKKKKYTTTPEQQKRNHEVDKQNESKKNTNGVHRSNSLSSQDSRGSKIPLPKYRTLQLKKGGPLSASCSNFETRSMIVSPGMDDWRMSGLLNTVQKSNSMYSLNRSISKRSIDREESPKIALQSSSVTESQSISDASENTNNSFVSNQEVGVTSNDSYEESTEEIIDISLIVDEVIPEECDEDSEGVEEGEEVKEDIQIPSENNILNEQEALSKMKSDDSRTKKTNHTTENNLDNNATKIKTGSVTSEEISKHTYIEERYELDGENYVTIQHLDDIVLEKHLDMPEEVHSNDWLVLNLTHGGRVIESY